VSIRASWCKDSSHRTAKTPEPMSAPSPDAAALGRAVRMLREERGISQVQLAARTGFMQSWISHVERGSRNPSWSNVVRLAEGLGVSVSELVARAEASAT
jgi:XRE family transcriptional regulator, regulator of sulfur utilization